MTRDRSPRALTLPSAAPRGGRGPARPRGHHARHLLLGLSGLLGVLVGAQRSALAAPPPPSDESVLGEFVVTGHSEEQVTRLAVLPSLVPDYEDVVVHSVVRRDLELSGLFEMVSEEKAPSGRYGFDDPVDVPAWKKLGADVLVKINARRQGDGAVEVYGIAYFSDVGSQPVYEKRFVVAPDALRVTAHRVVDALLGAITGTPGGFASRFTYAAPWGRSRRVFTMDADGHELHPVTPESMTAIMPAWGPDGSLFFSASENYMPFALTQLVGTATRRITLPTRGSVYGVTFDATGTKMAVALSDLEGSSIWVGKPDGTAMRKISSTLLATHPVFSPSGKLAWIGGTQLNGTQRVYLEGKAISPAGFTSAAPTFCATEDGIRLVYAVQVGGGRQDLVMSAENGSGMARLTQDQGSNSYPACSPDGRMLAFFSTRKNGGEGMYLMSLKRWTTRKVIGQLGESLRWDALPPIPAAPATTMSGAPLGAVPT